MYSPVATIFHEKIRRHPNFKTASQARAPATTEQRTGADRPQRPLVPYAGGSTWGRRLTASVRLIMRKQAPSPPKQHNPYAMAVFTAVLAGIFSVVGSYFTTQI